MISHRKRIAFTLIELVVVMACLLIAVLIISPTLGNRPVAQLAKAAEMVAGDLEFAQADSMVHSDDTRVFVIDLATNSYRIASKSNPSVAITHPDQNPYLTCFGTGRASFLNGVKINKFDFGGDSMLGFKEQGDLDQVTPATIELGSGGRKIVITIDPLTGRATISGIQ